MLRVLEVKSQRDKMATNVNRFEWEQDGGAATLRRERSLCRLLRRYSQDIACRSLIISAHKQQSFEKLQREIENESLTFHSFGCVCVFLGQCTTLLQVRYNPGLQEIAADGFNLNSNEKEILLSSTAQLTC